jgi:hypothetical protein
MPAKKLLDKRQYGKNIQQNWDDLSLYDDDPETAKFYQLTDRQSAALQGICDFLKWRTRYQNLPAEVDVELFGSDTVYRLQNPIDPGECQTFPPYASFITYEPNDPFRTPDLVPAGYTYPPWYIASTAAELTYDAQLGAAVTTFERLPPLNLSGFPRFRVTVNGIGTVTLHLAAVNIGGMAQITVDDNVSTLELIDLIQDKLAVPPETANIIEKEYYFGVAGEHRIDVIMLPALQDQIPPVMFGGGLNGVTLCGFGLKMPSEDGLMLRQSLTDSCILEQSADGETWSEAFDFSQCASIASGQDVDNITIQQKFLSYINQQNTSKAAQQQYSEDYTGDPSSVNPDAPDDDFAGDGSTPAKRALCAAIDAYLRAYAYSKVQQLDVAVAAGAGLLLLAAFLTGGLAFPLAIAANVAIGAASLVGGVSYNAARTALTDTDALDEIACCMRDKLEPLPITEANWNDALDDCSFTPGSNEAIAMGFIADGLAGNYLTFVDFLGTAVKAQNDGQTITCVCDPFSPVSYSVADCLGGGAGGAGTITFVSGDEYDITTIADVTGGYSFHIREATEQLFAYRHVSGSVNSSIVKKFDDDCVWSGSGGGASNQNQYLKELSIYTLTATTIRIRFYTPTE